MADNERLGYIFDNDKGKYIITNLLAPDGSIKRPGYIFDNHKKLVQELYSILDQAAVEYDEPEDVVDDFTAYLKEWARQREEG